MTQATLSPAIGCQELSAADAIAGRRSVRRFLSTPVERETITAILGLASRSASGINAQPWNVLVVLGEKRDLLCSAGREAAERGAIKSEYDYSPQLWEPYISRRRKVGFDLYSKYGIAREDIPGRKAAALRNYDFFGAPVGLFFTMDRRFRYGQWLDLGIFMGSVMIAARSYGLETCAQEAWCEIGQTVRDVLQVPDDQLIVCGMSLGYEDSSAPENTLVTERASVAEFATFCE